VTVPSTTVAFRAVGQTGSVVPDEPAAVTLKREGLAKVGLTN